MKYIIGLGNPGSEYENNRHNIGFIVLDQLVDWLRIEGNFAYNKKFKADVLKSGDLVFIKPQDYMNNSGQVVRAVINFYEKSVNLNDVIVLHDDLDIVVGQYKFQLGKGPKVHNGLLDLNKHLGGEDYWHARIGVDNRRGDRSMPGSNYVLSNFNNIELDTIAEMSTTLFREIKAEIDK
ncbi:MAG: aminoacyl-tRNA hydrolase [Candidatus Pacebacteria bacterium]|nr:aminoacyl-tRNA hydrolase [Candidatus Paceibacterota bacterium]